MRGLLVGVALICPVVLSCSPAAESSPERIAEATEVAEVLDRTSTPGTVAGLMRRTPGGPDVITRVVPTPTPTQRPTAPTPEPDYVATITSVEEPITLSTTESPDGNWRTEVIRYECVGAEFEEKAYEELVLVDLHTGARETVDSQLQYCGGLGAAGLAGLFWSPSNRYFYYTDAADGSPEGCGYWSPPYWYLDVSNRRVGEIGGGARSPDGRKIAAWQARELAGVDQWSDQWTVDMVIWDIDHGELMRFPAELPGAYLGMIAWSPTSTDLAYLRVTWACTPPGRFLVARVDLTQRNQTLLLSADEPSIDHLEWTNAGQLLLTDTDANADWRLRRARSWVYTLADHDLRRATPGPPR